MSYTGAQHLVDTAAANGVSVCFANPGTTELHLVEALDRNDTIRTVLCTFEGVCSGAADAFARMTGMPALGLYHLGPGFANSLANQHNARRHHTPMINVIGDQASWHLDHDAPLTSDISSIGDWVGATRYTSGADDTGASMAGAIRDTLAGTPRIVNLVVPADHAWGAASTAKARVDMPSRTVADADAVGASAAGLRQPGAVLIVGGEVVSEASMRLLGRIRAATGCAVHLLRAARVELGRELPDVGDLPYFPQPLRSTLADAPVAVMAGRSEPVTFFGYPDEPSLALPDTAERIELCDVNADLEASLAALAAELGADADEELAPEPLPELDPEALDTTNLGVAVARAIRPGHIVIGESLTSGATYRALAGRAEPHTLVGVLGGAIGGGLPAAVGAAVACPDRPVLAVQADGSALYTFQSLWTMAREQLDVTVVICANRRYLILDVEFGNHSIELSDDGKQLTDLANPAISYVKLAEGFGVPSRNVTTGAELADALAWAAAEPGPHLIEAEL